MISIIIPVYNGEKHLKKCIESIRNQTYKEFEVIIVDDGSTDGTSDICDGVARADTRFQVIHQSNMGVSAARNAALARVRGDVVFIDADDYVELNYLEKLKNGLEYTDVDICCSAWQDEDENMNIIATRGGTQDIIINSHDYDWHGELRRGAVSSAIFKQDIVKGITFDESIYVGEDLLFWAQCLNKAKKIYFVHEMLYHYVHYQESACHGKFNLKKITLIAAWKEVCKIYRNSYAESMVTADLAAAIKGCCCMFYSDPGFLESVDLNELILTYRKNQHIYFEEMIRIREYRQLVTGIIFGVCPKLYLNSRKIIKSIKTRKIMRPAMKSQA